MQHEANQPIPAIETVAAITESDAQAREAAKAEQRAKRESAKPATPNGQAAQKRVRGKQSPATVTTPVKPTQAEREAAQAAASDARRLAKQCAAEAVSAFYSGASKPFKAASDRFADLNFTNAKAATQRQAALMLALITYGAGNMRADGTFTRGGFTVPARLVNTNAKPGDTVRAQPESGCTGNMLGRALDYVSGPKSGRDQSSAVYRLRPDVAIAEIQAAFGDKAATSARKLLASFAA